MTKRKATPTGTLRRALSRLNAQSGFSDLFVEASRKNLALQAAIEPFFDIFIKQYYADVRGALDIGEAPCFTEVAFVAPDDLTFFRGLDWPGHGLRHPELFWWRTPQEPDFTQLLKKAFFSAQSSRASWEAWTFLHALARAGGLDGACLPDSPRDIKAIEAEKRTEKGRLDLLFTWSQKGLTCMAALEIKFGARLHNDLCDYETLTREADRRFHIVLGCRDELSQKEHGKNWVFCYWHDVLRHWESLSAKSESFTPDTSRLRSSLWHKMGVHA